jgi:ATP-dependent helicase HrpA
VDQIGYRAEDREFIGPRRRKFYVFPGSALHKKPPKWLMAAELTETSRLYARTVAKIEPQWLEHAANHLLKREHFDPYWQTELARVGAYERVVLFGLVLAPRRRIDYGRVNPAHAREILIREALVEGRYQTRASFFVRNRRLIEEIRDMEERARRHDMLIDREELYRFYAERIPQGVHTGAALEHWLRSGQHERKLFLTRAQLVRPGAEQVTEDEFPSYMVVAGAPLPLRYRFEPGHEEDGVTLSVPLAMLNQLDARRCEWLVPGHVQEKMAALIRSLPRHLRRNFSPAAQFAQSCAQAAPFAVGGLLDALSSALKKISGFHVPRETWQTDALPAHLKLRFEILDHETVVAKGRNLTKLQTDWGKQAAARFQALPTSHFERSGLVTWNFGALPDVLEIEQPGMSISAYPALIDTGDSVSLRLTDTPERARYYSRVGARRLYMLRLREQVMYLRKRIPDVETLCLHYHCIDTCEALKTALVETVFDRVFIQGRPLPADNNAFESRLDADRGKLAEVADALYRTVKPILARHYDVRRRLNGNMPIFGLARDDLDSQLSRLVYPGFIQRTPARWLIHIPRFLQAVELRLDRINQASTKDQQLQEKVEPHWRRCLAHMNALRDEWHWDLDSETYRWMIEEYRVSLFAQQLGTSMKISAKRLEEQWRRIAPTSGAY